MQQINSSVWVPLLGCLWSLESLIFSHVVARYALKYVTDRMTHIASHQNHTSKMIYHQGGEPERPCIADLMCFVMHTNHE